MKTLRIVLVILIGILFSLPLWLPLFFGLTWIPGWPAFFAYAITLTAVVPVALLLRRLWFAKKEKPDKKPAKTYFNAAIVPVILIAFQALTNFGIPRERKTEYLHSPNNKNTAYVQMWNDEAPYAHGYVYPTRARFLYESDKSVFWTAKLEDLAFTWIDDETLEITYTHRGMGETIKEYIHW